MLVMDYKKLYCKSFVFAATSFDEYSQDGRSVNKGICKTKIIAKVMNSECIGFLLQSDAPVEINQRFGLPIMGIQKGDILDDRIMYGRLPDSFSWDDSNEPLVCEINSSLTCVRFAMMSPLRLVEFQGCFIDIRTL